MLNETLKAQLREYLTKVNQAVAITAFVDSGAKSKELLELLQTIESMSELVSLQIVEDSDERIPSFRLSRQQDDMSISFAGIPMGHEFSSLVLALLQTGGHPVKIDPEVAEQVAQLEGSYDFESYISLSCQNCPEVVQTLNALSVLNPNIRHTMIDGALFQNEVDERQIMAVPSVFLNGKLFSQGRIGMAEVINKIDSGASERQAQALNQKDPFDLLVVGGGPAGASAAIYAARKGIRTGIVTERFGGQVLDTLAIENFISVKATEGPKLVAQLEEHVKDYDVDIMVNQKASGLNATLGQLTEVTLESGAKLFSKAVIVATGARWREMNVPGENEYRGKGVAYCPHCDGPLFKGKSVAVIGGGNSGVEAAIDLAGIVKHVTLIEFDDKLRADSVLQKKLASLPNVDIILSALTTEVLGDGKKVTGITYQDRKTDKSHELTLDGVFVQIGLLPNTRWLPEEVELSPRGEIEIDDRAQTSLPGVFAAGDATTVPFKQIIIAMGEGSKAALSAFDYLIRTPIKAPEKESAA